MKEERRYYEAYDDRYRQIHTQGLRWFDEAPSGIVMETIREFGITSSNSILELGCGEGRDAFPILKEGYQLTATDVSGAAISFCKEKWPEFAEHFHVLDCVSGEWEESFAFIYAVAVVHMLVPDEDRNGFYRFIRNHLQPEGIALICTMGDGKLERQTDIGRAFELQDRIHEQTGRPVRIAGTSCRMVNFETFRRELERNGLEILKEGITSVEPDFNQMMYAVVRKKI